MKKALALFILGIFIVFISNNCSFAQEEINEQFESVNTSQLVIKAGTKFMAVLEDEISSSKTNVGDEVSFRLLSNFVVDKNIIFFRKSIFKGIVVDLSKKSLLGGSYNLVVEIDSLDVPFRGIYKISAHPEFELAQAKRNKGRRFKIGLNRSSSEDLIDNMNKEQVVSIKENKLFIEAGTQVPIVLDEDLTVKLKK